MKKLHRNINLFIVFLISISFFVSENSFLYAKYTKKAKTTSSTKSKSSKDGKNSKKKKNRRSRRPAQRDIKINQGTPLTSLVDSVLADGVIYHNYLLGPAKYKFNLHVIEYNTENPKTNIEILKANEHIDELKKLQDIAYDFSVNYKRKVLGAINANFWRAGSNYPIGPVVSNGEIVEMNSYKQWSSGLFTEDGTLFIDNFLINGKIISKNGSIFNIKSVNRRKDSIGIILYNRFSGDSIPYVPSNNINKMISLALEEAKSNFTDSDSTEEEIDTLLIKEELIEGKKSAQIEYKLPKIVLLYLQKPAINADIACVVHKISNGTVNVPENGCVISFGKDNNFASEIAVGDTINLKFETDSHTDRIFVNGVSGTPRLVRKGTAKHEAFYEGSRGGRFINWQLPRTAIGIDKYGEKVFLVVVGGTGSYLNCYGANLTQLSQIMKRLGCYNAMNLDGGGSSIMIVDGKNTLIKSRPEASRRLSVGVAVVE